VGAILFGEYGRTNEDFRSTCRTCEKNVEVAAWCRHLSQGEMIVCLSNGKRNKMACVWDIEKVSDSVFQHRH
jgi:hypothetical protein